MTQRMTVDENLITIAGAAVGGFGLPAGNAVMPGQEGESKGESVNSPGHG